MLGTLKKQHIRCTRGSCRSKLHCDTIPSILFIVMDNLESLLDKIYGQRPELPFILSNTLPGFIYVYYNDKGVALEMGLMVLPLCIFFSLLQYLPIKYSVSDEFFHFGCKKIRRGSRYG